MKVRRYLVAALIAVAAAVLLVLAFRAQPVRVEAGQVTRGVLQEAVEEEARTRVIDRFVISAPVAGYLERIPFKPGHPVRVGDVLLTIAPLPSEALDARTRAGAEGRVSSAQAALRAAEQRADAARASAALARSESERLSPLRAAGQISVDQAERAEAEARRSAAALRAEEQAVEVARHELDIARSALEYSAAEARGEASGSLVVRAPVDGRVLRVLRESAGVVARADPLLELGDPRALEVVAEVLSDQAVRIVPGTRVVLERWGGPQALEGVVRTVEPSGFTKISALGVEEQRVLVVTDFVSPAEAWAPIGDGFRAEARFILWEGEDVLQAPASALFRTRAGWQTFVLDGDRVSLRNVVVGRRGGLQVEVLDGLREDERLVVHPDESLVDGARVTLMH